MSNPEIERLKQKFLKGMELAIKRLVERTKKADGELVTSKNDKVIRIKARGYSIKTLLLRLKLQLTNLPFYFIG